MSGQQIMDNGYGRLFYYGSPRIVYHEIYRPISGKPLRELLEKGLEVMEKNRAIKWLSDDRANSATTPEDQQWAVDVWMPRALRLGWQYWGLVVPEDLYGRMAMREMMLQFHEMGLKRAMVFTDPDEAWDWLVNV